MTKKMHTKQLMKEKVALEVRIARLQRELEELKAEVDAAYRIENARELFEEYARRFDKRVYTEQELRLAFKTVAPFFVLEEADFNEIAVFIFRAEDIDTDAEIKIPMKYANEERTLFEIL